MALDPSLTHKSQILYTPDQKKRVLISISWQYQIKTYQRMLTAKGIRQSMSLSRKGNCLDNAVNFFGILKCEFQSLIR
jgi:transposase InsO family protein